MGAIKQTADLQLNHFEKELLKSVTEKSAEAYRSSLEFFYPGRVDEDTINKADPHERNMSFFFSKTFLEKNKASIGFEVKGIGMGSKSVDIVLCSNEYLICIETKKFYSGQSANGIFSDIEKLKSYIPYKNSFTKIPKKRINALLVQYIDGHERTIESIDYFSKQKFQDNLKTLQEQSNTHDEAGLIRLLKTINQEHIYLTPCFPIIDKSLPTYEDFADVTSSGVVLIAWVSE